MTKRRLVVSNTQLQDVRSCAALHGFRHIERLRPKIVPDVLIRGRVAHAGYAAGYGAFPSMDLPTVIEPHTVHGRHALRRDAR